MSKALCKIKSKKGFTMVELLFVIVIIIIIAAIAIPIFSSQINRAREATDNANLNSAKSLAVSDYVFRGYSGEITYYFVDNNGGVAVGAYKQNGLITAYKDTTNGDYSPDDLIKSSADENKTIVVIINDGAITSAEWSESSGITWS